MLVGSAAERYRVRDPQPARVIESLLITALVMACAVALFLVH